jgi:hypothetical protein
MEIYREEREKNKKPGNLKVSRPEQERSAINKSLLSVQNTIPKRKVKVYGCLQWLSSMRKKMVRGGDVPREGHIS